MDNCEGKTESKEHNQKLNIQTIIRRGTNHKSNREEEDEADFETGSEIHSEKVKE